MGPGVQLKDRAIRRDEAAGGGLHPELGHPRLEQHHVLAVHRAAHGLLEDPAVLRAGARTDPGLDAHRAAQIKTRGVGQHQRRATCEGRRGVPTHRAGLTQADPRLVAAGDGVAAGIGGRGRARGLAQPPVPGRPIGEQPQRHPQVERTKRAAHLGAREGAAALARRRGARADLGRQLQGEVHRARGCGSFVLHRELVGEGVADPRGLGCDRAAQDQIGLHNVGREGVVTRHREIPPPVTALHSVVVAGRRGEAAKDDRMARHESRADRSRRPVRGCGAVFDLTIRALIRRPGDRGRLVRDRARAD